MQKKAGLFLLLGASVTAVAATTVGTVKVRPGPVAVQQAMAVPVAAAVQSGVHNPAVSSAAIQSSIARWNSLRQSDNHPFSSYASFLLSHRGWPGEAAMRRSAERQIDPAASSASEVVRYFNAFPPLTPAGHARFAFALLASGQPNEARAQARLAWTAGVLPQADEQRLLGAFGGSFTPQDHDARMDALLGNGDTQSAQRTLAWASPSRRPLYEARLALQTRAPDARSRTDALGTAFDGDPGLLIDKAVWLRSDASGGRQFLARPRRLTSLPANPEKFMESMYTIARGAAADRQWTLAYQIASQVDDIFPAGTDISARSYGERDQYTNLTWLAGMSAQRVGRHADAAGMFSRYARAGRSGQTRAKGLYWAARSASAAGQAQQSSAWLEQAAAFPDQFYGQLALERLGRPLAPPVPLAVQPTSAERTAFASRPLVQAARALGQQGNWSDQSLFIRAIAEQVEGDRERLLAAEYGRALGRLDLGVWVAREARNKGENFYSAAAFPELPLPGAYAHNWALAHGITRQESSFDRAAVSHAGARGLMQLMPGTARETASRLGMPYDFGRLTSDPSYNIMLGSAYFDTLLRQWGGNVPLAVASYNAGAGNVRRWVRENGDPRTPGVDIVEWIEQIPFFETRNYVQRVLENAVVYDAIRGQRGGATTSNRLSSYLGKSRPG